MSNWYKMEFSEVAKKLNTDIVSGLSETEVKKRQAEQGSNEIAEKTKSPWKILWEQFTASMVLILIAAAIASAIVGDYKDSIAIMAIVIFNAFLGLRQEYKAEKAMAALKQMSAPVVRVRRNGHVYEISAREIIPGDILLLEAGNIVPADARLTDSVNLRVQEAALTGESVPVEKNSQKIQAEDLALGDRKNIVYMGTVVSYGRGQAIVTETGMKTELGKIANMLQTMEEEQTPLQKRLDHLGKVVTLGALVIILMVVGLGLIRGGLTKANIELMMLTGISLVVAVVPEGLAAVMTITLALGAQRMLKRHALIRKLAKVETLGSVTVICSDKTGTLTQNRMTVSDFSIPGQQDTIFEETTSQAVLKDKPGLTLMFCAGALCNDSILEEQSEEKQAYKAIGDPTEGALVVASARLGMVKKNMEKLLPRLAEMPFDSDRKRMSTIHKIPSKRKQVASCLEPLYPWMNEKEELTHIVFTKGSLDGLLEISQEIWVGNKPEPMTPEWKEWASQVNLKLASQGKRIIAVACKLVNGIPKNEELFQAESNLVFLGILGMIDPPREEVKSAVHTCKTAGIRPVMITGDHPLTAQKIAQDLGIMGENSKVLTGVELEKMSVEQLQAQVEDVPVYARVSPEHKLKIVDALQKRGHIVAMTGDGVNDAPALKKADIGVAMGINGTDVAKEASGMVLQDDNFATIVAAVEEGRVIYDGARRFIKYLMTCNAGAIWLMFLSSLCIVSPDPAHQILFLLPIQILWINLMGDGVTALALGLEKPEPDIMSRPPYRPNENVFSRGIGQHVIWAGLLIGLISLFLGIYLYLQTGWTGRAQTMVFTTFIFSRMFHALAIRSSSQSLFQLGIFSNKALVAAVLATFICQMGFIYLEPLQQIFRTTAISLQDLGLCALLSSIVFVAVEIEKAIIRYGTKMK